MSVELSKIKYLIKSERSLPDQDLELIGFGCNLCDWFVSAEKMEYYEALHAHGKHNVSRHIHDPSARTVNIYKRRGNGPSPK